MVREGEALNTHCSLQTLFCSANPCASHFSLLTNLWKVRLFFFFSQILTQTWNKTEKPEQFKTLKAQALWKTNTREPPIMWRQDWHCSWSLRWNLFEWTWPSLASGQCSTSLNDLTEHSVPGTGTKMCWNPCRREEKSQCMFQINKGKR